MYICLYQFSSALHVYWYVYSFRLIKMTQIHTDPRPITESLWDCGWMLKYASQLGLA